MAAEWQHSGCCLLHTQSFSEHDLLHCCSNTTRPHTQQHMTNYVKRHCRSLVSCNSQYKRQHTQGSAHAFSALNTRTSGATMQCTYAPSKHNQRGVTSKQPFSCSLRS